MNSERVIVFDLGRVLIDFDHHIAVKRLQSTCAIDDQAIYNLFFDSALTNSYECGRISSLDFFQEVKSALGESISYAQFVPIWNEIFTPLPGALELLQMLKTRYPLYLASNTNELHFNYLADKYKEFFSCFEHMFLSHKLGMRKPDQRIYEYIINYIGLPAKNIIYTDDRIELITAARALGIDAVLFQSLDDFKQELINKKLIS